jgi:hypothetical protein
MLIAVAMVELVIAERSRKLLTAAVWTGAVTVAGYHLFLEAATITLPEPMGIWETAYSSIDRMWPNQYHLGNFVLGHDNYGPGYPAFCRPFLWAFANVLVAHRVANLVLIAGASLLVGLLVRINRGSPSITAAVVAIFFALNAGTYSIQARPDFLVLLEVAAILAVGQFAAQRRIEPLPAGLLLGALTLAAYLTKPYSLFAWGAVASFLVLFSGFGFGTRVAALSGAIWVAGVAAYSRTNPYYFFETFQAHLAHTSPDFHWFLHQCGDFALLACGPLLAIAGGIALWFRRPVQVGPGPVPRLSREALYWGWVACLAASALALGLGWHTGAYLTYFIHLALVPICLCATIATRSDAGAQESQWAWLPMLANMVVLMALAPGCPKVDRGWLELQDDVLRQPGQVVVDSVMEPMAKERDGVTVADTGMIGYALAEPGLFPRPSAAASSAGKEVEDFRRGQSAWFKGHQPSAVYLDFVTLQAPGGRPGEESYFLLNGLPWFSRENMVDYKPVRSFRIRPFYWATNERRQFAGTWEIYVIKFVRRPQ